MAALQCETRRLVSVYGDYDIVLTPTLAKPPLRIGAMHAKGGEAVLQELIARTGMSAALRLPGVWERASSRAFDFTPFTPVANFTGQPSMSVPLYWNRSRLPIGSMFTGRMGDEATPFRLAAQLEEAHPWKHKRAPVYAGKTLAS